ncbi:hypothetical protein HYALB_00012405 [Hymenoscyphus albidus]|uniref:UDP-glucose 6-dehydrogenase n=1 Tax=Hymenoscyphus albidus TaxID=595503 RepID=A0A9N9PYS6_9HELO|nr:hypothetical protein HYALB_00012405 [Hymenoscyphus albidus]
MEEIHLPLAACAVGPDFDLSTAPTTPDGSLTFSPVLQALRLADCPDDSGSKTKDKHEGHGTLNVTLESDVGSVKNVCCIGAGYVGGPTAAMIALQNPQLKVTVVDRDPIRIKQWNSKHLPIHEPGLENIIRITRDGTREFSIPISSSPTSPSRFFLKTTSRETTVPARSPNLFFSTDVAKNISEADIIFISVNTPTKKCGIGAGRATDMTAVEAVSTEVAMHAKAGAIIVEKSTVPCRTADMIRSILKNYRPDSHFEILSNPEFLSEGISILNLLTPSRILIGSSLTPSGLQAASKLASIYTSWIPKSKIITTNTYSSELSKLVANAFLAQRISSINSISALCEKTGASISEVAQSVGTDERIGNKFLKAGVGFGGSCFGKDVRSLMYISESLGLHEVSEYWGQVLAINDFQQRRFVRRVVGCLNGSLRGKKVAVLGVAFKGETKDMRESPTWGVLEMLIQEEAGAVMVWDPKCEVQSVKEEIGMVLGESVLAEKGGRARVVGDVYAATRDCDAVLVMVDTPEFRLSHSISPASSARKEFKDPRPFQNVEPTESELLSLHDFFVTTSNSKSEDESGPLNRFLPPPECQDGCTSCVKDGGDMDTKVGEKLDWARIVYHLRQPKWIFDGRGVLKREEIERLGGRLEGIGEVGRGAWI